MVPHQTYLNVNSQSLGPIKYGWVILPTFALMKDGCIWRYCWTYTVGKSLGQMSTSINRQLVCDALQAAILKRGKPEDVMVHSAQGLQYASKDYRALITQYQLTQSMSRRGNDWDNAVAESFFATLKKQAVYGERFLTRQEVQQTIFEYIEC